jgi:NTP pyrophosphatase (non-canonical NTP hydrolase)
MTNEQKQILQKALQTWGTHAQILIAVEEMSELTKALLKNINRGKNNRDDILEEFVDVLITLEQLKIIYGLTDEEINAAFCEKTEKIHRRLPQQETANK